MVVRKMSLDLEASAFPLQQAVCGNALRVVGVLDLAHSTCLTACGPRPILATALVMQVVTARLEYSIAISTARTIAPAALDRPRHGIVAATAVRCTG